MIDQTIAHFHILETLGAGGMGVVYRARDTHLNRFVAIKVLQSAVTADAGRKQRFIQEARAASALNHPHIVTVHDVSSDGGVDYIVMELVSGRTLAQTIGRKGLKLNEVLKYGAQVADALNAAHKAGIVHRDLKPANVMVTDGGQVKVLDFGLAKLTETADGLTTAVTRTPQTEEGTIVGTVSYMSPEQAEGRKVDARSDIFSFGSVLYEMATGRRAFSGETKIGTLSAILHDEPPPLEDAPPELEKIIARCLRKDPARRIQHIDDVKLALEDLKEESESGKLSAAVPRRRPRVSPWWIAAAVGVVLGVASIAFWWLRPQAPLGAPVLTQATMDTGLSFEPALSPDGKFLAYVSDRGGNGNLHIWVRQVGGGEPVRLTQDLANEREPAFSPDGTQIAFSSAIGGIGGIGGEKTNDGSIYVASMMGANPRKIAERGQRPRFSPDGRQIAYWSGEFGQSASFDVANANQMFVVSADGGAPRRVRADFMNAAFPEWAPDGRHLLFLGRQDATQPVEESIDWWVTPLDEGPAIATGALKITRTEQLTGPSVVYPWALIPSAWDARGGWLLFSARSGDSRNLWRLGVSPRTSKAAGLPERLTSSSAIDQSPGLASTSVGHVTVAFASSGHTEDIWSLPVGADGGRGTGEPRRLTRDAARNFHLYPSRDGGKLVFISTRSGHQEIWIKDLATDEDRRLTYSRGDKYGPSISPDGQTVAFSAYQAGRWDHYAMPAAGGADRLIKENGGYAATWSPDGKYLFGNSVDGRLFLIDVGAGRGRDLLAIEGRSFFVMSGSPHDRSMRFFEGGKPTAFEAPFQGERMAPEREWSVIDHQTLFSPDMTMAYSLSDRDGYTCLWARRLDPLTKRPVGDPRPVHHSHVGSRLRITNVVVGRDRIFLGLSEVTGNIWIATWKAGW